MPPTFPLDLAFRGERNYLHGTDLYESLTRLPGLPLNGRSLGITFHARVLHQPDLVLLEKEDRSLRHDPAFRGEMRIATGAEAVQAVLLESSRPVTAWRPCNEKAIAAHGEVDIETRRATLKGIPQGSAIEQVVFLNKKLHLLALPHLGPKWMFARLELDAPLDFSAAGTLALHLSQVVGDRFTRTDIRRDGAPLGTLFFSLGT